MKALLLCALLTTQAWGQVSQIEIRNFNFEYQAPLGEGAADSFSYGKDLTEAQSVKVERVGDDFEVLLEGVEDRYFTFKGAPDFMVGADFMRVSSLSLNVSDSLSFSLGSGYFQSPFRILSMNNVSLHCELTNVCLEKMNLKAGLIHSDGEGLVEMIIKALDSETSVTPVVGVRNLDFQVRKGKFTLSADLKSQISGKIKSKGEILTGASNTKVTIRVDEVKFGILNVTSKVFEEIKKYESDKLTVSHPYIYVTLK